MSRAIQLARQQFRPEHPEPALAILERGLAANPDDLAVATELARMALLSGLQDRAGAVLEGLLGRVPDHAPALALRALLLSLRGAVDEALNSARRAHRIEPGEPLAAGLLSRWLLDRCQPVAAMAVAETCLDLQPKAAQVRRTLAAALLMQGRAGPARTAADAALASLPGDPATIGIALFAGLYDDTLAPEQLATRHRDIAARVEAARCDAPLRPAAGSRLRVGFYSPDFRRHPVGGLIMPILEQLDRDHFEPICYAHLEQRDEVAEFVQSLPLTWREVTSMTDGQLLASMRNDRLDLLVDLAGHSHGGRPQVLRGRAAPIQLSWLGYPYSTGLPECDGLLGDWVTLPQGSEHRYSEPLFRLPLGQFCLQGPEQLPEVAPLPMLAAGRATFGSFNHLAKLSDRTVALWSRLLLMQPDARLVLCAIPLLEPETRALTAKRFAECGVEPGRLELRPPMPPGDAFLRQYADIDLALDPLPFSGGATTLDALRQGVPVLTLPGRSMHNRLSASVLRQLGLDEFVADSEAGYLSIAAEILADPERLQRLRQGMRSRLARAPASDPDRYTRDFERLLLAVAGRR